MKRILLVILFPMLVMGQTQIGADIDGENAGDRFGISTSLSNDGNIIAIGGHLNDENGEDSGHIRIYERIGENWIQIGNDIDGENDFDESGFSLSLSFDGSMVAVGAIKNDGNGDNSGHARIFENQNGDWVQIGNDIDGESPDDGSGLSVSLSSNGNVVAIGARRNDDNGIDTGHVRIFENQNGDWIQIGNDIDGESPDDGSGISLDLSSDGTIAAIGAISSETAILAGHVRVFGIENGIWIQIGEDIDGDALADFSGSSVSLSSNGDIVAIGAAGNDDNGENSGHVRIYENQNDSWIQRGQDIDGEVAGDFSGSSVSLSSNGEIVAIGAKEHNQVTGVVRIYQYQNDTWVKVGDDINGESVDDFSGVVSLSPDGSTVAVGAIFNDGNGEDSGHVRVYDLSNILSTPENTTITFTLYPNPTKTEFNIKLSDGETLKKATIYNNLGQLITTTTQTTVDTSILSSGVYFVSVETTAAGKGIQKLIIE